MKLESANLLRKFIFNVSHMSIFSQVLGEYVENENQIRHFSCVASNELSSHSVRGNQDVALQLMDGSHQNKILNHLFASISAEKPENGPMLNQVWVGSGSVSGFDLTISLSEIQVSDAKLHFLLSSFQECNKLLCFFILYVLLSLKAHAYVYLRIRV